jgi:hypothetical protein
VKTSRPSGRKRGAVLCESGQLSRAGAPPAVGAVHTSERRRLPRSSTRVTVNATVRPSGATAGAATVAMR